MYVYAYHSESKVLYMHTTRTTYTTYNVKYTHTIIIPSDKSTSPGIHVFPSLHCGPSILIVHCSPRKFPSLHLRQLLMWKKLLFKKICSYNRPRSFCICVVTISHEGKSIKGEKLAVV